MIRIESKTEINAPILKVWDELTHHEGMVRWPEIDTVVITQKGTKNPDGLGCIRDVKGGSMNVVEEITRFDAPHRMDYLVKKTNLPIQHHGGYIILKEENDITKVTWVSEVTVKHWNPFVRIIARKMLPTKGKKSFDKMLAWVKKELESKSPQTAP